jgi:uncharacterized protein YecE (DUF72 family)
MAPKVRIGTSGWVYDHWQGPFYPEELPQAEWFNHFSDHFATVEINNTFYNLPPARTFRQWHDQAPPGFRYAVKASRYITHMKKLKEPREALERLLERTAILKSYRGPLLVQLPPHWRANPERLEAFLELLPGGLDCAFEFRDPSWYDERIRSLLDEAGCAFVVHDMVDAPAPKWQAGDFVYLRFHGSEGAYQGRYGKQRLKPWARFVRESRDAGRDVYAYFNNDQKGYAVKDALALAELVGQS